MDPKNETERYLNFDLEVRAGSGTNLEVRILQSPDHVHGSGVFVLTPEQRTSLHASTSALERAIRHDIQGGKEKDADPPSVNAREFGSQLYRSIFPGDIEMALVANLARVDELNRDTPGRGLRIRLIFDPDLADVAHLPWELLYQLRTEDFLGRNDLTPISRCIPGARPVPLIEIVPPLRVLIVGPEPQQKGLGDLNLEREGSEIRKALQGLGPVEIEVVEPPTFLGLIDVLDSDNNFHVLHFMGHGCFDAKTGRGGLVFERKDGTPDLIPGTLLAERLKTYRALRLVVLNSCKTAKIPRQRGQNPFSGVATSLASAGLPAVIAMQFPISDRAAIAFSKKFYEFLAAGKPVDVAVAQGRLGVYFDNRFSLEWVTPTLFMQVPDGNLRIRGRAPIKLGIRSIQGWDAGMEDRTENLSLLDQFEGRRIREPASRWQTKVHPRLERFLEEKAVQDQALHLELPAHGTIAFAVGYHFEVQSGWDISVRQRGGGGTRSWWATDGTVPEDSTWSDLTPVRLPSAGAGLAVGVSISRDVATDVQAFLETADVETADVNVGFFLSASLVGGHGQVKIDNGAHAFALAEKLVGFLEAWQKQNGGVVHLFTAAPNGFMLFLGQLSRFLRKGLQLYEFDRETDETGVYWPSLRFPLPADETFG